MNDKMFELNIFEENKDGSNDSQKRIIKGGIIKKGPVNSGLFFGPFRKKLSTKKDVFPLIGTDIYLVREGDHYVCESAENLINEDDNEDESNSQILLESISFNEAREIIDEFAEKYGIEIDIAEPGTKLYESLKEKGLAAITIEANDDNLYEWENFKDLSDIRLYGGINEFFVVFALESIGKNLLNEKAFTRLLLHEYGHTKTMQNVTRKEWAEYYFKSSFCTMIPEIANLIAPKELQELEWIYLSIYYHLKPEFLANQYAGVNFADLIHDVKGWYPSTNWKFHRFAKILEYHIPDDIISILDIIRTRIRATTKEEDREYYKFVKEVNTTCFTEQTEKNVSKFMRVN